MGGIFGGPDNSAMLKQIELQKAETERLRKQAEDEKNQLIEREQAAFTARRRGGARMLLSEQRIAPEGGISEQTLGSAEM
jgi:hypothetical protein